MNRNPGWGFRLTLLTCFITVPLWLAYWLITTRYAILDDALIHLHYASMLRQHHFITFDGIQHGFGTSSLLYVSLLAVLRGFFTGPLLVKVVSDISYCCLLGTIFGLIYRFRSNRLSQILLAGLSLCLMSPMGIRWSTDGMETSLTNLAVVCLLIIMRKEQEERPLSILRIPLLVLFGAAIVFLRIELALIVALSALSIFAAKMYSERSWLRALFEASPLPLGAGLALISIRIVMGHFLPDTAVAKSGHALSIGPLIGITRVLGSSMLFGFGTALCWVLSLFFLLRRIIRSKEQVRQRLLLSGIENSAIFILAALSCLRGQSIQGVRYIIWPFIFAVVANASQMPPASTSDPAHASLGPGEKRLIAAFFIVALCLLPLDWHFANRAMNGRSQTFLEMRSGHLSQLFRDKTIVAGDVGFITYFTNGRTCDLSGLVGGRAMAMLDYSQRVDICARRSPAMMFLTASQIQNMNSAINLNSWSVCGIYDFTNVESNDRHYLIVPSASSKTVCRVLRFTPETVLSVVPSSS